MFNIKKMIKRLTMNEEEKYLSEALDHGDLERRIKRLERARFNKFICNGFV